MAGPVFFRQLSADSSAVEDVLGLKIQPLALYPDNYHGMSY
jgi:hypothetical protein